MTDKQAGAEQCQFDLEGFLLQSHLSQLLNQVPHNPQVVIYSTIHLSLNSPRHLSEGSEHTVFIFLSCQGVVKFWITSPIKKPNWDRSFKASSTVSIVVLNNHVHHIRWCVQWVGMLNNCTTILVFSLPTWSSLTSLSVTFSAIEIQKFANRFSSD